MGAWYTPLALVDHVVRRTVGVVTPGDRVRVLDPACGDGRFLLAAARAIEQAGGVPVLTGIDIDLGGLRSAPGSAAIERIEAIEGDALDHDWGRRRFDVIVGNPPFLSQLATATARRGGSRFGGGPYTDAAADFLALAAALTDEDGRVGLVLPVSVLTARDAGPIRRDVLAALTLEWFWSSQELMFTASVRTCAVGLRRLGRVPRATMPARTMVDRTDGVAFAAIEPVVRPLSPTPNDHWGWLIGDSHGLPSTPLLAGAGTLAGRATVTANFRDQYYGLVGAVSDDNAGPPLVTTGLIDPGRCWWGRRSTRFAKQRFEAPRVDLERLEPFMRRWAERCLVAKVLVASQSQVLEAVVDDAGAWLPAVPVIRIVPADIADLWRVAAVLTSPVASLVIAAQSVGSGLSASAVRVSQRTLGELPWPQGDLTNAVRLLRDGDLQACGRAVDAAFGVDGADATTLFDWWSERFPSGA